MTLSRNEAQSLFSGLQSLGWAWRGDVLYAPAESIWLVRDHPWDGTLLDMCERMHARLERIRGNRDMYEDPAEFLGVERDTAGLVAVLDELIERPR